MDVTSIGAVHWGIVSPFAMGCDGLGSQGKYEGLLVEVVKGCVLWVAIAMGDVWVIGIIGLSWVGYGWQYSLCIVVSC